MSIYRKIVVVILGFCVLAFIYYCVMLSNTNTLFADAKAIFEGKKTVTDDNPLYRYRFDSESYPGNATKEINLSISRVWVWHNFKNGYMKVIYSVRYLDENGEIVSCSIGVPSKWYIEKNDGEWKITKIEEAP